MEIKLTGKKGTEKSYDRDIEKSEIISSHFETIKRYWGKIERPIFREVSDEGEAGKMVYSMSA